MALLYQAAALSPRSTRGTGGPRFRCQSTRLPQAHHPSLCRSRRTRPHPRPPETSSNLLSRSPHPQSPLHPFNRQARPLQIPQRDPRRRPQSLGLAPKKNAFRSALQLSRAGSRRNPRPQRRLPRAHSSKPLSNSSPATAMLPLPIDADIGTFLWTGATSSLARFRALSPRLKRWAFSSL
jgi:hypothetical protein